jgi:hypothetical protein
VSPTIPNLAPRDTCNVPQGSPHESRMLWCWANPSYGCPSYDGGCLPMAGCCPSCGRGWPPVEEAGPSLAGPSLGGERLSLMWRGYPSVEGDAPCAESGWPSMAGAVPRWRWAAPHWRGCPSVAGGCPSCGGVIPHWREAVPCVEGIFLEGRGDCPRQLTGAVSAFVRVFFAVNCPRPLPFTPLITRQNTLFPRHPTP